MAKTTKQQEDGKPVYISFNKHESAALRKLGWRERWLYFELKWLANFKTGKAGTFYQQRLTFEQLAALVRVPSSQGRAGDQIDGKEAARLMMHLNEAGLVGEIDRRDCNDGLTFCLPLSPIDKKAAKAARDAERLPESKPAKLPAKTASLVAANDDAARGFGVSSGSPSVLMSLNRDSNTFFNTDGPGQPAPAPADAGGETPVAAGDSSPAAAGGGASHPETFPENPTAGEIEEIIAAKNFLYAHGPESRKFYARWSRLGISREELMRAVEEVDEDFSRRQTPAEVDRALRRAFAPPPVSRHAGVQL